MAPQHRRVLLDDRLLIEELLAGLGAVRPSTALATSSYWYHRACRVAAANGGGWLSGPFDGLPKHQQEHAIHQLLRLRDDIALPDPRATVPLMAELAARRPRLNVLNLEVAAAAISLDATVWLSDRGAAGVLPVVLADERIPWRRVPVPPVR